VSWLNGWRLTGFFLPFLLAVVLRGRGMLQMSPYSRYTVVYSGKISYPNFVGTLPSAGLFPRIDLLINHVLFLFVSANGPPRFTPSPLRRRGRVSYRDVLANPHICGSSRIFFRFFGTCVRLSGTLFFLPPPPLCGAEVPIVRQHM